MNETLKNTPHLFRTCVDFSANRRKIEHNIHCISIGSCFSENIARRLQNFQFNPSINPTGILYNPASISCALRRIISGKEYSTDDLFNHDGVWKSFNHHSSFNNRIQEECLHTINARFHEAYIRMSPCHTLIITFGTAFVYLLTDTKEPAANCHRLPHDTFRRSLLSIEDIVKDYTELFNTLYTNFPRINIIVTVSPVRHLRDNPHENQISKAHLLAALHELETNFPKLYYFPAYEIIMDELRDYRFYENDMIHPAPVAIDYIFERFTAACVERKSQEFISLYKPILQAKKHIIKDYHTESSQLFVKKQLEYIDTLQEKFPNISLSDDRSYFISLGDKNNIHL